MFQRRSSTAEAETSTVEPPAPPNSKGRPTPKRREAENARRQRARAPKSRKEAAQQQREKSRASRARMQKAMETGNEADLPARDKGPVRRFCRNYVDSRRTVGEFLLPLLLVIMVLMMIPAPAVQNLAVVLWLATIVVVPVSLFFLSFGLRRELRQRHPDESHKGATFYAIMRSTQIRRFRLPKPQVKAGEKI